MFYYPLTRYAQRRLLCFTTRCPDVCPVVPYQHGLVRRAGESITHMLQRRYHMSPSGLSLSSYKYKKFSYLQQVALCIITVVPVEYDSRNNSSHKTSERCN